MAKTGRFTSRLDGCVGRHVEAGVLGDDLGIVPGGHHAAEDLRLGVEGNKPTSAPPKVAVSQNRGPSNWWRSMCFPQKHTQKGYPQQELACCSRCPFDVPFARFHGGKSPTEHAGNGWPTWFL